jgi:hypothetical protein
MLAAGLVAAATMIQQREVGCNQSLIYKIVKRWLESTAVNSQTHRCLLSYDGNRTKLITFSEEPMRSRRLSRK